MAAHRARRDDVRCRGSRVVRGPPRHSPKLDRQAAPPCEPQEKGRRMTRRSSTKARQHDAALPAPTIPKIAPIAQLKQQWRELFAKESPPFSGSYITRRLAYRIQEPAHGGLKPEPRARLAALGEQLHGRNVVLGSIRADGYDVEPPWSIRKPGPNRRLSAARHAGEPGCEREEWNSDKNLGDKILRGASWGLTGATRRMASPACPSPLQCFVMIGQHR